MGFPLMLTHILTSLGEVQIRRKKSESIWRKKKMDFNKISWLAVVVMLGIAVCSSAVDILHLQDEQQEDASSSIEKRSLKSGVS